MEKQNSPASWDAEPVRKTRLGDRVALGDLHLLIRRFQEITNATENMHMSEGISLYINPI